MRGRVTTVAYERSMLKPVAPFPFKAFANRVTFYAGLTVPVTNDDLLADILFVAGEPMNTEVMRIDVTTSMVCVYDTVVLYFLRDRRRILTEILGNLAERFPFIQCMLDVFTVSESKVQVVARYIL